MIYIVNPDQTYMQRQRVKADRHYNRVSDDGEIAIQYEKYGGGW